MTALAKPNRLKIAMGTLGVSARDLSRMSGVDHSLIAKWAKGERPLSARSKQLSVIAKTLAQLDQGGRMAELTAPYRQRGEAPEQAMWDYLLGEDVAGLSPQVQPQRRQTGGEYTVSYRVFLGGAGLRKALLANLDYLATVPPGMELTFLCPGREEWLTRNPAFAAQFIPRLNRALQDGARLTILHRRDCRPTAPHADFLGPWLLAHLRGYLRSLYYTEEPPPGVRFATSIPGYLSTWAAREPGVEDNLYTEVHTDLIATQSAEAMIAKYQALSQPVTQYGFLRNPRGPALCLWKDGPLPALENCPAPGGNYQALCRVPGIGILTAAEYRELVGGGPAPRIPDYLFPENGALAPGAHRIVLCREDVMEGLRGARKMHLALSRLLHRRVFVSRQMLAAQLRRLLLALERGDVEVALMPRVAFSKLQMEMVCWQNSAALVWLQDASESAFLGNVAISQTVATLADHVWDNLLAGWKRKEKVMRQLRKWLGGKELDTQPDDSAVVRNWDIFGLDPKE